MESSAKYVKIPGMSDKGTESAANGAPQATENSITAGQNDALIVAKDVTYSYRNGEQVSRGVKGVDLEIRGGEFVVVLGRNGSGKSTLAKLLNGFLVPDEGTVTVNGVDTADDDKIFDVRSTVGMVFKIPTTKW